MEFLRQPAQKKHKKREIAAILASTIIQHFRMYVQLFFSGDMAKEICTFCHMLQWKVHVCISSDGILIF